MNVKFLCSTVHTHRTHNAQNVTQINICTRIEYFSLFLDVIPINFQRMRNKTIQNGVSNNKNGVAKQSENISIPNIHTVIDTNTRTDTIELTGPTSMDTDDDTAIKIKFSNINQTDEIDRDNKDTLDPILLDKNAIVISPRSINNHFDNKSKKIKSTTPLTSADYNSITNNDNINDDDDIDNNNNNSNMSNIMNTRFDYDYNVFESTSYCGMIHHVSCLYPTPNWNVCNLSNIGNALKNLFLYYFVGFFGLFVIYILPLTSDGLISLGFFVGLWWINIMHATKLQFWGGKNIIVCDYACNIRKAYNMYEITINRRDGFIYLKIVKPFEKVLNKKICSIPGFENIDIVQRNDSDNHKVTRIQYKQYETNRRQRQAKFEYLDITCSKFIEHVLDKVNFIKSSGQFQRYHCPSC